MDKSRKETRCAVRTSLLPARRCLACACGCQGSDRCVAPRAGRPPALPSCLLALTLAPLLITLHAQPWDRHLTRISSTARSPNARPSGLASGRDGRPGGRPGSRLPTTAQPPARRPLRAGSTTRTTSKRSARALERAFSKGRRAPTLAWGEDKGASLQLLCAGPPRRAAPDGHFLSPSLPQRPRSILLRRQLVQRSPVPAHPTRPSSALRVSPRQTQRRPRTSSTLIRRGRRQRRRRLSTPASRASTTLSASPSTPPRHNRMTTQSSSGSSSVRSAWRNGVGRASCRRPSACIRAQLPPARPTLAAPQLTVSVFACVCRATRSHASCRYVHLSGRPGDPRSAQREAAGLLAGVVDGVGVEALDICGEAIHKMSDQFFSSGVVRPVVFRRKAPVQLQADLLRRPPGPRRDVRPRLDPLCRQDDPRARFRSWSPVAPAWRRPRPSRPRACP